MLNIHSYCSFVPQRNVTTREIKLVFINLFYYAAMRPFPRPRSFADLSYWFIPFNNCSIKKTCQKTYEVGGSVF
jgi:hypothetical protein